MLERLREDDIGWWHPLGMSEGMTEDEVVGWHHWLNGCESEQTPGDGKGLGSLVCAVHGVAKSGTWLSDWTSATNPNIFCMCYGRASPSRSRLPYFTTPRQHSICYSMRDGMFFNISWKSGCHNDSSYSLPSVFFQYGYNTPKSTLITN